jgi:predicted nucleic-acid-binding protein
MIGVDTNILLRFLVDDDAAGCRATLTFDRKAAARVPGMELLA